MCTNVYTFTFYISPSTVTINDRVPDKDEEVRCKEIISKLNSIGRNLRAKCNLNDKYKEVD